MPSSGAHALGPLAAGVGDDCAVLEVPPGERLVTSLDTSLEDVHFRRDWLTPEEVGYRATMAALSDLAAMAASPLGVAAALSPPIPWRGDFLRICDGIGEAVRGAGTRIVGGDLTRGSVLSHHGVGARACGGSDVARRGARVGDALLGHWPAWAARCWRSGRGSGAPRRATSIAHASRTRWRARREPAGSPTTTPPRAWMCRDGVVAEARTSPPRAACASCSILDCLPVLAGATVDDGAQRRGVRTRGLGARRSRRRGVRASLRHSPSRALASWKSRCSGSPRWRRAAPANASPRPVATITCRRHDALRPRLSCGAGLHTLHQFDRDRRRPAGRAGSPGIGLRLGATRLVAHPAGRVGRAGGHPRRRTPARRTARVRGQPRQLVRRLRDGGAPRWFKFVAKAELFRIPLFGPAMRTAGMIAIERQNQKSARGSIHEAAARIHEGASVILFPEGDAGTRLPAASVQEGRLRAGHRGAGARRAGGDPRHHRGCRPRGRSSSAPGASTSIFSRPLPPPA